MRRSIRLFLALAVTVVCTSALGGCGHLFRSHQVIDGPGGRQIIVTEPSDVQKAESVLDLVHSLRALKRD